MRSIARLAGGLCLEGVGAVVEIPLLFGFSALNLLTSQSSYTDQRIQVA